MTAAEEAQYASDTALLGERVAYWFIREHQGWSVLDEIVYWAGIGKVAWLNRDSVWSPFEAA